MTIATSSHSLLISGLQQNERVVWMLAVHEPRPYSWRDAREEGIAVAAGTSVTVPLRHPMEGDALAFAFSVRSGEVVTAVAANSRFREVASSAFGMTAVQGSPASIQSSRPDVEMLVARPGVGAWSWTGSPIQARGLGSEGPLPATLVAQDVIVAVDFARLEYAIVTVGN